MGRKYYPYIDLIRILSMLAIIVLHSASYGLRTYYFSTTWDTLNIITSLATCAVPLFFMISGAMLLSDRKTDNIGYMLKKRLPKLIFPLLFWSLACIARDFYYIKKNLHVFDPGQLWDTIISILASPAAVHLWFMYALIPLYIAAPFIRRIADSDKLIKYLLTIWVLACLFKTAYIAAPEQLKPLFNISVLNKLNYIDGFLGYFVLGYYLHEHNFKVKNRITLPLILLMIAIIACGTAYATYKSGEYSEIFKSYTSIWVIALSTLIYIAAIQAEHLPNKLQTIINKLSPLSLGIYMSGNFFLGIMRQEGMTFDTAKGFVLCNIYTFALCFVCITLLKNIKPLCYISTGNRYKNIFKKQRSV